MGATMPTGAEILGRVLKPPLRDRRFWVVQGLILAVGVGHLLLDLRGGGMPLGMPDSVTVGLFLVPVIYAALSFGLSGSCASAAWGILLMVPDLLVVDSRTDTWVDGTILLLTAVVAVAVGQRVERETIARRRAGEAIQAHSAAEARYRALFEASSAPTLVVDSTGALREANPAAKELFGARIGRRQLAELLGEGAARRLLAQAPPRMVAVTTEGGQTRALHPLSALVTDRGGDPLLQIILQDLTEEQERQRRTEAYATQVLHVQEEERRRVAQDIHDDPLQTLIYLLRRLEGLSEIPGLPPAAQADLAAVHRALAGVIAELRQLAQGLRPPGLDDLGLPAALRQLVAGFADRTGVEASLHVRGVEAGLDRDRTTALFRIVQEALRNVERHAGARRVTVEVTFTGRSVRAQVHDDGHGFAAAAAALGLGVRGMRERAELFGGRLEIESPPGRGTTVQLTLPVAPRAAASNGLGAVPGTPPAAGAVPAARPSLRRARPGSGG
ncbi:MAG TPA: ATP-binding protein [Candidatus Dormibacteraeota bacterium]|nr:ATP-binding protein [Candidatus Dormibacteraeota bacterium]